jgi:hypothetical protein
MTTLPSTEPRTVPDSSHRDYIHHHDTVYADARVCGIDITARYYGEYSRDNGQTWKSIPMPEGWTTVCGGHVQAEAASALLSGWDVTADGGTRIVRDWDGALTRWTTHDTVTQYDIATQDVYRTMTEREGRAHVAAAISLGDIVQDYTTTDRDGRSLRVVLYICQDPELQPHEGCVYEFTR